MCYLLAHMLLCSYFFFFFSSRRRHTRLQGDWSSDVCSSDLIRKRTDGVALGERLGRVADRVEAIGALANRLGLVRHLDDAAGVVGDGAEGRSEERRVGKECRSRWSPYH